MAIEHKPRRQAVVLHTIDNQRIKPACPMCDAVAWGKLVPQPGADPETIETLILTRSEGQYGGMGIQVWVCMNCGFLWQRTGALDKNLETEE